VDCAYETVVVDLGLIAGGSRDVHVLRPAMPPPPAGHPVVVFFQGSLFSAELSFAGARDDLGGRGLLALTMKNLVDAGFLVVAPEALGEGTTAWQTNVPPASVFWEGSADDQLLDALLGFFDADDAAFGPVDTDRLYATGISSGGFMTSRMAVSYAGRFRALAIHSAGYANCSALCVLPSSMPADHPPTLFVHGALDIVVTTPIMTIYRDALADDGVDVDSVIVDDGAHEWLAAAATAVPAWFLAH
jgi:poly(3-hydroxyoctanoate) depolymerase